MSVGYLQRLASSGRLSGVADALNTVADTIMGTTHALEAGAIPAATEVLRDPALPEVIRQVTVIKSTEKAGGGGPGIGLSNVVGPLKVYAATRLHPWLIPVGVVVLLGVPFLIGRATKRG
jgi:hypothetical protein